MTDEALSLTVSDIYNLLTSLTGCNASGVGWLRGKVEDATPLRDRAALVAFDALCRSMGDQLPNVIRDDDRMQLLCFLAFQAGDAFSLISTRERPPNNFLTAPPGWVKMPPHGG